MPAQSFQICQKYFSIKKLLCFFLFVIPFITVCNAQNYTQTIRGRLTDKETRQPIAFATVVVRINDVVMGSISDENGHYRIEKVPVGRAGIEIRMVGYETLGIGNVEVTTGRETIVNAELTESTIALEGVVVRAQSNKEVPINPFASASARTFSVEEAQRFAGASYDVSRMAMNFAGVMTTDDTQNEIVIRGNSPIGMIFRLDGIDIPNPNHFGDGSASGGVISMLNVNTLANSDFLTGAFPAEYSNTLSGVFDLKTRDGNNEKHEFIGQFGIMGTEFSAEGPIAREKGSSYMINYRYTTVQILNAMVDLNMPSLPTYQDGLFKLNFPSTGRGTTSIIGFGGTNRLEWLESTLESPEDKNEMGSLLHYDIDQYIDNKTGVLGITHTHILGNNSYMKIALSGTTVSNHMRTDSICPTDRTIHPWSGSISRRNRYAARAFVNTRLNSRNSLRAGLTVERQDFKLNDSVIHPDKVNFRTIRDFNGYDHMASPYVQWQHRVNQELRFNVGVSSNYQYSARNFSLEPRAGLNWEPIKGNTFGLAYGLHSIATPVEVLQNKVLGDDGTYSLPNRNLVFTKSHHMVGSYDKIFSGNYRLKTEFYYQVIENALVELQPSSFSMLNRGSGSSLDFGALTNAGNGYNYGIELTAEKFMDKGTYFLSTLSLFESKYKGSDGVVRNTAFNGNYVLNILGGKEFRLGARDSRYVKKLNLDAKFNLAGGKRYSPIDLEVSRQIGYTFFDETRAFEMQMPHYMSFNFRAGVKFIGRYTTQEIAINITNVTNRKNPFFRMYDPATDNLKTVNQFGLMPDLLYRIVF